jgi:hypothetical protein
MLRRLLKRPAQIMAIGVVIIVISILSTGAAVRGTQNFNVTCAGFESNGGRVILNRDNTGSGAERIALLATDGFGNVIYGPVIETLPVGTSLDYPRGLFESWSARPRANPLFFTITSEAGNGFARETVYRRQGDCRDLSNSGLTLTNNAPTDEPPAVSIADAPGNEAADAPVDARDIADLFGLQGTGVVNTGRLNIRSGDGIQYRSLGVVTRDAEVFIIGRNEAATWWYVEYGPERGWVSADFIILRGDLQYAGAFTALEDDTIPRGERVFPRFIFYQDYPIYAQPNSATTEVCLMPGNIEYNVLGRTADFNWYRLQVTCNGAPLTGWAQARLGALRQYGQPVNVVE